MFRNGDGVTGRRNVSGLAFCKKHLGGGASKAGKYFARNVRCWSD